MFFNKISLASLKIKLFFVVILVMFSILWVYTTKTEVKTFNENSEKQLKYILLWTRFSWVPFFNKTHGQEPFIRNNCTFSNCYVTSNKGFFGKDNDIRKFIALFFNGVRISGEYLAFPEVRHPHQKYVFFTLESGDNYPVCDKVFDGFFNWTSSFVLESDVPYPYLLIRDMKGNVVGPKRNMKWVEKMNEVEENLVREFQNKSKAVAWFVSNCVDRNGRFDYVDELKKELRLYGLKLDVYGSCGHLRCGADDSCNQILRKSYYFYLAMENSFSIDYVTEKVLRALNNYALPVVYGGANYSWFLPPHSYLDARDHHPKELAAIMNHLITHPNQYYKYFQWRYHYTYHSPTHKENICAICAALNNKRKVEGHSAYEKFRQWWNPSYEKLCNGAQLMRHRLATMFYSDYELITPAWKRKNGTDFNRI